MIRLKEATIQSFEVTMERVPELKELWQDKAISRAFARRNEFDFNDNAEYFIEHLERIAAEEYEPTEQDILRTRVKTVGIVEREFEMQDLRLSMVDVGGQRNERRKWIHVFDVRI